MLFRVLICVLALSACKKDTSEEKWTDNAVVVDLDAITSEARPTKRSEVTGVADEASNKILIFGGNEGPIVSQAPQAEYLDTTWVFEPTVGFHEVTGGDHPSARGRYGATLDPVNGRALVFGGRWRMSGGSGNYTLFDELWSFDFATEKWTLLDEGGGPSARYYPHLQFDEATGTLYVFGGVQSSDPLYYDVAMDVWSWDGKAWSELSTDNTPTDRTFVGSAFDSKRNQLIITAGQRGDFSSGAYDQTFSLDLDSKSWELLDNGSGPDARLHPRALYQPSLDRYVVFGGHTNIGDMNDLWAYNPVSGAWSLMYEADAFTGAPLGCNGNPQEVPADYVDMDLDAPERRQKGVFVTMHDNFWVIGGMHGDCSDHLDDVWRFDLGDRVWHEVVSARAGEACERRDDDCSCLCL